ncbi:MAG: hypothetical protein HZB13_09920 [Acidobacteria bacterium]|nr:hypothetical protein [Acidobacteriota bacterium]
MPFDQPFPRSFVDSSVRQFAPAASGLYGISNASGWLFIGESDNICESLLAHLRDSGASLFQQRPTGFVFETCDPGARAARQSRLIFEYNPSCNGRQSRRRP